MLRNLFSSFLIVTSAFAIAFGQTPEGKKQQAETPQVFAFSFDGDGSYLGIQTQEITKENFAKYGLRDVRGVAVDKVMDNSPASAGGLQAGDVIIRFNGEEVTSARKLTRLISEVDPDHQAKVTVLRNGHEQEITATIAKRQMPKFREGNFQWATPDMNSLPQLKNMPDLKNMPQMKDFPDLKNMPDGEHMFQFPGGEGKVFKWSGGSGRQIGAGVMPLTKQLAEHFGVDGGVMISEVRENSPAAKAGLKAGDIIVEVNGKAVGGDLDLVQIINEKKDGDVQLTVFRGGSRQTLNVTPEPAKDGGFMFQTIQDGFELTPAPGRIRNSATTPIMLRGPRTLFRPGRIV